MTHRGVHTLNTGKKLLLAATGMLAVSGPLIIGIADAPRLRAQADAAPLAFEVASIHVVPEQRTWARTAPLNGRFVADGATLRMLIQFAYHVEYFQISGGPEWTGSRDYTYDIQAKPERPADLNQLRRMLQTLLAERFHLKLRHETKDSLGYVLTVANRAKLKESTATDGAGMFTSTNPLSAKNLPITDLTEYLSGVVLSQPVIDRTGLTGRYDFTVRWSPDQTQFRGAGGRGFYSGDPNGPTIVEAFHEQLGLKLEPRRVPTDFIVIEQAQEPSDN